MTCKCVLGCDISEIRNIAKYFENYHPLFLQICIVNVSELRDQTHFK